MDRDTRRQMAKRGAFRRTSSSRQRHLELSDVKELSVAKARAFMTYRHARQKFMLGLVEELERAVRSDDLAAMKEAVAVLCDYLGRGDITTSECGPVVTRLRNTFTMEGGPS